MQELPMLIKKCLTHGITIYPFQLDTVLKQYEEKKIPDEPLSILTEKQIRRYVHGLYLSGQEPAGDWTIGHSILLELGFCQEERTEGHRTFTSLVYEG